MALWSVHGNFIYYEEPHLNLIAHILRQALVDAISVQQPRPQFILRNINCHRRRKKGVVNSKGVAREIIAADARGFLLAKNQLFKYYCELLGFDPEWVERKSWEIIKQEDKRYTLARSKRYGKLKRSKQKARKVTL